MPTPKHLTAIARSNQTAAEGYVSLEQAKKEADRPWVLLALLVKKYSPSPEAQAEKTIMKLPNNNPTVANAPGYSKMRGK